MSRTRRGDRPQRRRFFVGCEGESERGYVRRLGELLAEHQRPVHLDAVILGGGDPLAMLERAERQFRRRGQGAPYAAGAVFLDSDRRDADHDRDRRAINIAARLKLLLVWQETCHEAFLLRHLPDCEHLRPPSTQIAEVELRRRWPEYEKAMPGLRLASRIDRGAVLRAAAVEGPLRRFLETIGFETR